MNKTNSSMQHSFKFSNIMKWSFGVLALLLVSTTARAQAVEAVINNDMDCKILVRVWGLDGPICDPNSICSADFTVNANSSITVLPGDMPCGVDEFLAARVRTLCAGASGTVDKGACGGPGVTSTTFTAPSPCDVDCDAAVVHVDLTSGTNDIEVDVY